MTHEIHDQTTRKMVNRFLLIALLILVAGIGLVILAGLIPVSGDPSAKEIAINRSFEFQAGSSPSLPPLLAQLVSRKLIQPAQVKAAVKDSGAAEKILQKLKLQGVVQLGNEAIAYIQVEKQGTVKVRRQEKILGLEVIRIEPGRVTLSLEGVEVVLCH